MTEPSLMRQLNARRGRITSAATDHLTRRWQTEAARQCDGTRLCVLSFLPRLVTETDWLPTSATGFAFEGPDQIRGDPAPIEGARLWLGLRSADTAVKIVGIEGYTAGERLGTRQGMGVAPGDLVQAARAVDQIPIARRSLPLTERAIASGLQQSRPYVGQRQVEGRGVGRFADCPGGSGARYLEIAPEHDDLTGFAYKLWRPREIPNRNLP